MSGIITLNSKAIALLQQQHHTEALVAFSTAMCQAHSALTTSAATCAQLSDPALRVDGSRKGTVQTPISPPRQVETVEEDDEGPFLYSVPLVESAAYSNTDSTTSPDNMFCFYSRALDLAVENKDKECGKFEAVAIILFNMGLVYHQSGLISGESNALRKGLELYELSVSILSSLENGRSKMDIDLLQLALFNNLGHLYSHFLQHSEAQMCRDRIVSLLARVTTSSYQGSVETDDCAIFVSSVVTSFGQHNHLASAA